MKARLVVIDRLCPAKTPNCDILDSASIFSFGVRKAAGQFGDGRLSALLLHETGADLGDLVNRVDECARPPARFATGRPIAG